MTKYTPKKRITQARCAPWFIGMIYLRWHFVNPHVEPVGSEYVCQKGVEGVYVRVTGGRSWPSFQKENRQHCGVTKNASLLHIDYEKKWFKWASMSYIFWELLIWRFIWAIRKHFLSILRGVSFLLPQWDAYVNLILHCGLKNYWMWPNFLLNRSNIQCYGNAWEVKTGKMNWANGRIER